MAGRRPPLADASAEAASVRTQQQRRRRSAVLPRALLVVAYAVLGAIPAAAGPIGGTEVGGIEQGTDATTSWEVSPSLDDAGAQRAWFVHQAAPGGVLTDVVVVTNRSPNPIELSLYAADAYVEAGTTRFDLVLAGDESIGVGAWVTPEVDRVTIGPRSSAEIPFRIDVPADAPPGDHAGGIVTSTRTARTEPDGRQVWLEVRVAARIHLRVDGVLDPRLVVDDVTIDRARPLNPLGESVTVTYTIRNEGNVRLGVHQSVRIEGPFGVVLAEAEGASPTELLPGSWVRQEVEVPGVIAGGRIVGTVRARPVPLARQPAPDVEPVVGRASAWAVPWLGLAVIAAAGVVGARPWQRKVAGPPVGAADPTSADHLSGRA